MTLNLKLIDAMAYKARVRIIGFDNLKNLDGTPFYSKEFLEIKYEVPEKFAKIVEQYAEREKDRNH